MNQKDRKTDIRQENLKMEGLYGDPHLSYIHKKAEKVTSAIYLVTNLIQDLEPIKWSLRQAGVALVGDLLNVLRRRSEEDGAARVERLVREIMSLLEVAHMARLISEMNVHILLAGCRELLQLVDEMYTQDRLLPEAFFEVEKTESLPDVTETIPPKKESLQLNKPERSTQEKKATQRSTTRREKIHTLFSRKGKQLSASEVAHRIGGVSEKTIQRDLRALVKDGVLLKTGSRRWTLYELK